MKRLVYLLIAVVALLSIAAGAAKIMAAPQEVEFFDRIGASKSLLAPFGAVQALTGIAVIFKPTRVIGAYLAAAAFFASSLMIFVSGDVVFSVASLLPVCAAAWVGWVSK